MPRKKSGPAQPVAPPTEAVVSASVSNPPDPIDNPVTPPWTRRYEGLRPEQRRALERGGSANVSLEGPGLAPYQKPRRQDATYWDPSGPAQAGPYTGPKGGPAATSGKPRRSGAAFTQPLEGAASPYTPPRRTDY